MLSVHKCGWPTCMIFVSCRDICTHTSNKNNTKQLYSSHRPRISCAAKTRNPEKDSFDAFHGFECESSTSVKEFSGMSPTHQILRYRLGEIQHTMYYLSSRPEISCGGQKMPFFSHNHRGLHTSAKLLAVAQESLYTTLGVEKDVTMQDLKNAYHALAKKHHPDISHHDKSENPGLSHDKFVKINEAFMVLSDPKKRRQYDMDMTGRCDFDSWHLSSNFLESYLAWHYVNTRQSS